MLKKKPLLCSANKLSFHTNVLCIFMNIKKAKAQVRKQDALEKPEKRQHSQITASNTEDNIYSSVKFHLVALWTKGNPERDDKL